MRRAIGRRENGRKGTILTQKHEIVIKRQLADFVSNRLRGGDKLPIERNHSDEPGVERASLQVALKKLQAMQDHDIR